MKSVAVRNLVLALAVCVCGSRLWLGLALNPGLFFFGAGRPRVRTCRERTVRQLQLPQQRNRNTLTKQRTIACCRMHRRNRWCLLLPRHSRDAFWR